MSRATHLRDLATGPMRRGVVALAAIVVALVALVISLRPLLADLVAVRRAPAAAAPAGTASTFASDLKLSVERINGRSLFYTPAPPPPDPIAVDDGPPPPPPPPSTYGGPALIAMINGAAWFSDGRRLTLHDDLDHDFALLSLSPPWSAQVRWRGVEFNVPLFERSQLLTGTGPDDEFEEDLLEGDEPVLDEAPNEPVPEPPEVAPGEPSPADPDSPPSDEPEPEPVSEPSEEPSPR